MSELELERIVDQLERAYRGKAWHGPALLQVLSDVDEAIARRRPIAGAHTIAELVLHVIAWQDEAVRRLDGEGHDLSPAEDWPEAEGWSDVLARLAASTDRLAMRIRNLDPSSLDAPVQGQGQGQVGRDTVYRLLHGVVQHNLYHAGQIAILKKNA